MQIKKTHQNRVYFHKLRIWMDFYTQKWSISVSGYLRPTHVKNDSSDYDETSQLWVLEGVQSIAAGSKFVIIYKKKYFELGEDWN